MLGALAVLHFSMRADIAPGYFAGNSVLADGKWVKIKVTETGMQQVTAEQLARWGFSDPSRVAVCGYGGAALYLDQVTDNVPDDLAPVPASFDGKRLMFYGIADFHCTATRASERDRWTTTLRRNYYAPYGCYFLTDALEPVAPVSQRFVADGNTTRTEGYSQVHVEREEVNPNIGARFFFGDLSDAKAHDFPLSLPGYVAAPGYLVTGGNTNASSLHIQVGLGYCVGAYGASEWTVLPGGSKQNYNLQRRDKGECTYEGQVFSFVDNPPAAANGEFSLNAKFGEGLSISFARLDFINVCYRRSTDLSCGGQNRFMFDTAVPWDIVKFTNAPDALAVWDVTDPAKPFAYEVSRGEEGQASISLQSRAAADKSYLPTVVAFNPETDLHPVEAVGQVVPQNLHSLATPDLVVVAARGLMDQAERVAEIHRSVQGMDVVVVDQEKVYNEFSSGVPSVTGIRRFLRMLYDRTPGKLKALLIVGGTSQDNRDFENYPGAADFFVPMYQDQNLQSAGYLARSYATDAIYGMLSEDFSTIGLAEGNKRSYNLGAQMEISVGRLPVRNHEECVQMVDKIDHYMHNLPYGDSFSRVLLSADRGTKNSFVQQADEIQQLVSETFPDAGFIKAYSSFYYNTAGGGGNNNTEMVSRALSQGVNFWFYTGHATPSGLGSTGASYWGTGEVSNNDYDVAPFAMFGTCRPGYYDHTSNNLACTMLRKKNGGSIGLVASLREVYLNNNQVLGLEVTRQFFTSPENSLQGDVFRRARNELALKSRTVDSDSVNIVNTSCYNFIGDPAVPIFLPTEKVTVTSVDGKTSGAVNVSPLVPFVVEGTVGSGGNASESFDGELSISIYDAPQDLIAEDVYDKVPYEYPTQLDNDLVYNAVASVKKGRFSHTLTLPVTARPSQSNRMVLYANSPDGSRRAIGSFDNLVVNAANGIDQSQFEAPTITALYFDDPSFVSGDLVSASPTLYAEFGADEAGLVGQSPLFGYSLAITVDDSKTSFNAGGMLRHNPDGSASLAYPMSNFADGPHSLELRVANNAGLTTSRTINFVVVNSPLTATLTVDPVPASDNATINLVHSYSDIPDARLIISDMSGTTVFSDPAASFPYEWNLKDNAGHRVAPGRYKADVKIHSGLNYGAAAQGEIIVID